MQSLLGNFSAYASHHRGLARRQNKVLLQFLSWAVASLAAAASTTCPSGLLRRRWQFGLSWSHGVVHSAASAGGFSVVGICLTRHSTRRPCLRFATARPRVNFGVRRRYAPTNGARVEPTSGSRRCAAVEPSLERTPLTTFAAAPAWGCQAGKPSFQPTRGCRSTRAPLGFIL